MRSSSRARAAFLLLYGALLAWQVDRWLFTPHGLVSTWAFRQSPVTVETGSPTGVSQTFTMGADGLDGVWLRPRASGGSPRGELLVDLSLLREAGPVRLERVVVAAPEAVRRQSLLVPFRPVRDSRGSQYRIDVRHVHPGDGPAIALTASREDSLRDGRLFAAGVEQWGDLVFETSSRRATLPYWIHQVLRPWPAWVRSWPVIAGVLLAFNLVLAWACAVATGMRGASPDADGTTEADALRAEGTPGAVRRLALALAWAIAIGGIVVAARPTGRFRSLDLIDALPDARMATSWSSLHQGISAERVLVPPRIHEGIVALPASTIAWTVDVPRGAVLRLGATMRPDVWERQGDGVVMLVHVEQNGRRTTAAALTLFPFGLSEHRRLFPLEIPLEPWAGQRVSILLETTPERWGNAVNDVPVWTDPRIEWPRNPAAGRARVIQNSQ